ncbi:MAG: hypothetical protein HYV27_08670 [Candidatus Hydrogenedentes bacterium]|nr:hypothetical protein [Candidatus Hydrogenedentota bacterium]
MRSGAGRRLLALAIASSLVAGLTGCQTAPETGAVYERDGVRYGVTEGRFRGRWWNYYERGRSFQGGGFFEEAEADFRTALLTRSQDSLWPRSYGMHFLPEYFPNRELGITLFLQGRVEEGKDALEKSLNQQFSARAEYYAGMARTAWLQETNADQKAPWITIKTAADAVSETRFTVEGQAFDDTFVAAIAINGVPVSVLRAAPEVAFRQEIALAPGKNVVELTVRDLLGKETRSEVVLANDVDGPAVSFDPVERATGLIAGVAYDPSGVQVFRVNGTEARLVRGGDTQVRFEFEPASAPGNAPLIFECEDRLGNITRGALSDSVVTGWLQHESVRIAAAGEGVSMWLPALLSGPGATPVAAEPIGIALTNLEEGGKFYQDEIVVALKVEATASIREVSVLGEPVPVNPNRTTQVFTRRIALNAGANTIEAAASDEAGNTARATRTVTREANALELPGRKLSVALVSNLDQTGVASTRGVVDLINSNADFGSRFEVVARDTIDTLLNEQELASLVGDKERQLLTQKIIPAEAFFWVRTSLENGVLEIVVDGDSSERIRRIATHVDVAGPVEEQDRLIADLVTRLQQEFVRAPGQVLRPDPSRPVCTLSPTGGAENNRKCLVYRIVTESLGGQEYTIPEVIAEGFLADVTAATSVVEIVRASGEAVAPIERGHYVVLK